MLANMTVDTTDPRSLEGISPVSIGLLGVALAWYLSKMSEISGPVIFKSSNGEMQEMVRTCQRKYVEQNVTNLMQDFKRGLPRNIRHGLDGNRRGHERESDERRPIRGREPA